MANQSFKWRDHLPVHPAAELFPMMSEAELRELGEDIKANGLRSPIIVYDGQLLDGRNRLDAMALVGIEFEIKRKTKTVSWPHEDEGELYGDIIELDSRLDDKEYGKPIKRRDLAYDYVVSVNIRRRHLTAEQKRELITKILKVRPEASDRQIAKQTNSSPTTVGAVRKEKEATGDVSKLDTRTDAKGRKQPASKPKAKPEQEIINLADRRAQMQALIDADVVPNDPKPEPVTEKPEPEPKLDFEKVKEQVAAFAQKLIDLAIEQSSIEEQQRALVERANLTPSQAREIKKLLDEFESKRPEFGGCAFDFVDDIIREDDKRKRCIKQARDPQKALDDARKQEQRDQMEGDRDEAKEEARESGELWSDIKDQWESDWFDSNWTDEREQGFLDQFKREWQRDHGQEYPNSSFAAKKDKAV